MESGEERVALLHGEGEEDRVLARRCLIESKKLWWIVGPAVFSRVVTYSMNVITLAFAGHLGDLELASITIANTVVVGFSFGLMLGMASGLETLCGQAFGARKYDMLGVLEIWYYRILILLTGNLKNAEVAVDAISICISISGWELMIHLAFLAGTGVRVADELGAGNGKGARFAPIVSVTTSSAIGLFFCVLIVLLHDKFAFIYTTSSVVLEAVDKLSVLHSILLFQVPSSCTLQAAIANARMQKWSGPNRP
ncbi:hypothetical protein OPV22_012588 [Ensete ventricosum]|uniref:Protein DETOXIFICATION n=1 Tax=Ensete ventricosum TaxID=4639 RepID=A0AAV8QTL5_ENSVE|nr:hypothetical protein OPV22_012588 [Ensete ventricosum]